MFMASVKTKAVKAKTIKAKAVKKISAVKKSPKKAVKPANITTPIAVKQNESQIMKAVAEETGLKIADVKEVLASLNNLLSRHMKKRGSGEFKLPKLGLKVRRVKK